MKPAPDTEATRHQAVTAALARVLADTYTLYLQTHNFHWNVTGPYFYSLHKMFEEQYQEMAAAVDEIAERIRALGQPAPGTYADFARIASVREVSGAPEWSVMVRTLAENNDAVVRTLRAAREVAATAGDEATVDLMVQRTQAHEKSAWMLRSTVDNSEHQS